MLCVAFIESVRGIPVVLRYAKDFSTQCSLEDKFAHSAALKIAQGLSSSIKKGIKPHIHKHAPHLRSLFHKNRHTLLCLSCLSKKFTSSTYATNALTHCCVAFHSVVLFRLKQHLIKCCFKPEAEKELTLWYGELMQNSKVQ